MCTAIENQMKGEKTNVLGIRTRLKGLRKKFKPHAFSHSHLRTYIYIYIPGYPICARVIKLRIEKKIYSRSRFSREYPRYREDRKAKNIFTSQDSYVNVCPGCTARKGADLAARFSQIYESPFVRA